MRYDIILMFVAIIINFVNFRTLQELVEHYSRDADGLCVNLRKACVQVLKSDLFVMSVT